MRRVSDLDILACSRWGGRPQRIATVVDPAVAGTILAHLRLLHAADAPGPAPPSDDLTAAAPAQQCIRTHPLAGIQPAAHRAASRGILSPGLSHPLLALRGGPLEEL